MRYVVARQMVLPAQQEVAQTWSGIGFRIGEQHFVAPMGEIDEVLHEPRYTMLPGVKAGLEVLLTYVDAYCLLWIFVVFRC